MIEIMVKYFVDEFSDDTVPLPDSVTSSPTKKKASSVEERNKTSSGKKKSGHTKHSKKEAVPDVDTQFGN